MSEATTDLLHLRSREHWSHDHPQVLIEEQNNGKAEQVDCSMCEEPIHDGSNYYCCTESGCKFYLHKICADLPSMIHRPFFHRHTLELQKKPPGIISLSFCDICYDDCEFFYSCCDCNIALDVKCALLPQLIAGDFSKVEHASHDHPLILATKKKCSILYHCAGCWETTPGPIYSCADCEFYLHKKCAELPPRITHPSHRKHPLFLLTNAPPHQEMCSCYLCKNQIKGFAYQCSLCDFGLKIKHVLSNQLEIKSHEHPFYRVSRPMSFICDACGTSGGDCIPYVCNICDLAVHKDCIWLPKIIKITRHFHPITHVYFLLETTGQSRWECRICYDEVNTEYGSYYCSDCKYIVHVNCAIHKHWFEVEIGDEKQSEALRVLLDDSKTSAEDVTATEIKHIYHQHNLNLGEEIMRNAHTSCDGCMQAISSGSFYFCKQCNFFIHKSCTKLPLTMRFWLFRFPFALLPYGIVKCGLCKFYSSGFNYYGKEVTEFAICLRCYALSDTLEHQGHKHRLFFDSNYEGGCSGCGDEIDFGYRCKDCNFLLDFTCFSTTDNSAQV